MKLYKYLMLVGLLGIATTGANAGPIGTDPGVILRGDGLSMPITGLTFAGAFPTPTGAPFQCTSDGPQNNCFQNANTFTFIAIHLFFDNAALTYTCDNSQDPFFTSCQATGNEVTFSGLGFANPSFGGLGFADSSNACGGEIGCQGIQGNNHFEIGINTNDITTYSAIADKASSKTPEPASALLFVIAIGAIALFLKRRSNLISA